MDSEFVILEKGTYPFSLKLKLFPRKVILFLKVISLYYVVSVLFVDFQIIKCFYMAYCEIDNKYINLSGSKNCKTRIHCILLVVTKIAYY